MTSRSPRKIAGCCALCDKPLFEIIRKYTEGPRTGEPADFGKPNPDARRVTFLLLDGTTTDMTFCESCDTPLAQVWCRNMAAFAFEFENRSNPLTEKQYEQQRKDLVKLADNIPLGVLSTRKWSDIWPS